MTGTISPLADVYTDPNHSSGDVGAGNGLLWFEPACGRTHEIRSPRDHVPLGCIDRAGTHLDHDLIIANHGLGHFSQFENIR